MRTVFAGATSLLQLSSPVHHHHHGEQSQPPANQSRLKTHRSQTVRMTVPNALAEYTDRSAAIPMIEAPKDPNPVVDCISTTNIAETSVDVRTRCPQTPSPEAETAAPSQFSTQAEITDIRRDHVTFPSRLSPLPWSHSFSPLRSFPDPRYSDEPDGILTCQLVEDPALESDAASSTLIIGPCWAMASTTDEKES